MAHTSGPADRARFNLYDDITGYWAKFAVIFAISHVVFATWPGIDLWASGLFYAADTGFPAGQIPLLQILRGAMWNGVLLVFLVTIVMSLLPRRWAPLAPVPAAAWRYCAALFVLGPLVLTNAILKAHWGRARPRQTDAFGGDGSFTPPFQMTDQCSSNCSFVSGETSGVVALAIVIFVLTHYYYPARWVAPLRVFAVLIAVLGSVFRLAKGGHYLSDIWFAAIFMGGVAMALAWLWGKALRGNSIAA